MKPATFIALAMILTAAWNAQANVITLCNMPYSPGQATTFIGAQALAVDGDTIYVHGSNFSYGSISVDRPLVIIGTGHNPNKQSPLTATFGLITVNTMNVQLIGLTFTTMLGFASNGVIRKCRLTGEPGSITISINYPHWLIEGNIFDYQSSETCVNLNGTQEHIIQNNLFATLGPKIFNTFNGNTTRTYILNNIFLGDGGSANACFDFFNYVVIRNNIFYGMSPYVSLSMNNLTIEKNITFNCVQNDFLPAGTYTATNLVNVDPQLVSPVIASNLFEYTYDFSLTPASPGHNYGTDGTDVGVFGGLGQLFTMTGEPSIAEVTAFTITSPTTIAPGGTLTISVTSKRVP